MNLPEGVTPVSLILSTPEDFPKKQPDDQEGKNDGAKPKTFLEVLHDVTGQPNPVRAGIYCALHVPMGVLQGKSLSVSAEEALRVYQEAVARQRLKESQKPKDPPPGGTVNTEA